MKTLSLLLRNLFFTVVNPGLMAGLIPYWISGVKTDKQFSQPFRFYQYSGSLLFIAGLVILFDCIIRFAFTGRGTLSPADPTKNLVVEGFYKHSRNPMYVGVMMILIGEAVFFQSVYLWIYLLALFVLFNLFIMLVEEPRLRTDFAREYNDYCKKVRRWL